jgi:pSer/pThr/pTyr-binding forkhead associated (FHA) protein
MRFPRITLDVTEAGYKHRQFSFERPETCVVGRAEDCGIRMSALGHLNVSRHHCLLEIDPPFVQVRDLNSRNGTFVNGDRIPAAQEPEEAPARVLRNGDLLRVGNAFLSVMIEVDSSGSEQRSVASMA